MSAKTIEDVLWDEWFDAQFELCRRIDAAVDGIAGRWSGLDTGAADNRAARAALYAAVLEHCGEAIRREITLAQEPTEAAP